MVVLYNEHNFKGGFEKHFKIANNFTILRNFQSEILNSQYIMQSSIYLQKLVFMCVKYWSLHSMTIIQNNSFLILFKFQNNRK